ncbi:MAG: hypothetical protein J6U14_05160 [Bacteroidaceae bacterium]|nr:hypothetical protein [Bacteroidaceae bacterium]
MKKFAFMFVCLLAMLSFSNNAQAQDKKNPFIGTWTLTASTPMGDTEMDMVIEEKEGKITGYLTAEAMGDEKIECEDINTEKADEISFTFYTAMAGMNIDMYLTLDGEDKAKGAMMGQFPIEGKRK